MGTSPFQLAAADLARRQPAPSPDLPAMGFDEWWQAVSGTFNPMDVDTERRDYFRGVLRVIDVMGAGPTRVFRRPA